MAIGITDFSDLTEVRRADGDGVVTRIVTDGRPYADGIIIYHRNLVGT